PPVAAAYGGRQDPSSSTPCRWRVRRNLKDKHTGSTRLQPGEDVTRLMGRIRDRDIEKDIRDELDAARKWIAQRDLRHSAEVPQAPEPSEP
ncbi:hypothetical protein, partial [Cereibacter sphaeroides]|uniref:hypothetical protein n=1 Tax=Cereibacter sphaeroides TaxID=1063 RepID=UPI001F20E0D9